MKCPVEVLREDGQAMSVKNFTSRFRAIAKKMAKTFGGIFLPHPVDVAA